MPNDCIETTYARDKRGYGQRKYKGKMVKAHRVAYALHHGVTLASMAGKIVRHTCDNPPCVNPEHLVLGTHKDNADDRQARGRGAYQTNPSFKPNCVLTDEQVSLVRERYIPYHKEWGGSALARKLGVSQSIISATVCGLRNNR